ncbi:MULTISPECIES: universal stress protein [unclassified Streptomyces]|uniref:universal stress protein n=1 Tax=unclassified Streptomyces TaxID=2593676 RepID=UPI000C273F50|nr:universal stress protein [Streptomyces sp. CB02959]PJN36814.1 universal stress protein [Streptomyces sp. CB02959]
MELPLVVGVDGSDAGLRALDWAVDEAALHGLPLRLVHASRWERYEGVAPPESAPAEQAMADRLVASAADRAARRNPEVEVSVQVLADDAVTALLREAPYATAVVLGCKGRGEFADLLLGSVSLSVAARARHPVVVVRGDRAGLDSSHDRVLLGIGDTAKGSPAVRFAFREAEARGCALDAIRAWHCPAHESADRGGHDAGPEHHAEQRASELVDAAVEAEAAAHPTVHVRRTTVEGPAHRVLVRRSAAADLLVLGARHRHGHFGLQLGRVGHAALHHAACPVAVVPRG